MLSPCKDRIDGLGYGPHLAPCELSAEGAYFSDVVLMGRLREAIWRLNPGPKLSNQKNYR